VRLVGRERISRGYYYVSHAPVAIGFVWLDGGTQPYNEPSTGAWENEKYRSRNDGTTCMQSNTLLV